MKCMLYIVTGSMRSAAGTTRHSVQHGQDETYTHTLSSGTWVHKLREVCCRCRVHAGPHGNQENLTYIHNLKKTTFNYKLASDSFHFRCIYAKDALVEKQLIELFIGELFCTYAILGFNLWNQYIFLYDDLTNCSYFT